MTPSKTSEIFGFLLSDTARTWRGKLDQRLKPLGLTQAQWLALVHLSRSDNDMTQKELAERIGIESPTLVRLLDRMARNGWVVRRESEQDRRSKTVHLTDRAQAILHDIHAAAAKLRKELLKGIPESQLDLCADVLRRINASAQNL